MLSQASTNGFVTNIAMNCIFTLPDANSELKRGWRLAIAVQTQMAPESNYDFLVYTNEDIKAIRSWQSARSGFSSEITATAI